MSMLIWYVLGVSIFSVVFSYLILQNEIKDGEECEDVLFKSSVLGISLGFIFPIVCVIGLVMFIVSYLHYLTEKLNKKKS